MPEIAAMPPGRRKRNLPDVAATVKENSSSNKKTKLDNSASMLENKVLVIFQRSFEKELSAMETSLKFKHNQVSSFREEVNNKNLKIIDLENANAKETEKKQKILDENKILKARFETEFSEKIELQKKIELLNSELRDAKSQKTIAFMAEREKLR